MIMHQLNVRVADGSSSSKAAATMGAYDSSEEGLVCTAVVAACVVELP